MIAFSLRTGISQVTMVHEKQVWEIYERFPNICEKAGTSYRLHNVILPKKLGIWQKN